MTQRLSRLPDFQAKDTISGDRIYRIEKGMTEPSASELVVFCQITHCDVRYLLTGQALIENIDLSNFQEIDPQLVARYQKLKVSFKNIVRTLVNSLYREQNPDDNG